MKKDRRFARIAIPLMCFACFQGAASAAPFGPKGREINWVQPSGEKVKLRVYGDDYYARTETESGHTVVYNSKDRAYHYAVTAENGDLKPSGVKAHLPPNDGLAKHLDLPPDRIRQILQANRTKLAGARIQRWNQRVEGVRQLNAAELGAPMLRGAAAANAKINAAPVTGKKVGLTILAEFPNDSKTSREDPVPFPVTRGKIVNFCNQKGYNDNGNTGSVRDYFFDQSLGAVSYTQIVTPIVTLTRPRNYYNFDDYPTNSSLRDAGEAGRMLIADAVKILEADGFDFSGLTVDGTGNAIATNLFFAGSDSGVWAQGLWPHQWSLAAPLNVGASVNLYNYQVTNIEDSAPVIGTFCHENGHLLLDYPDLYDIFGEGVGEHCLMGSGNYLNDGKTPSPINAYLKDVVGWENVTTYSVDTYVTKKLPTTGNVAYKILKPGSSTESFYVENRGRGDKWAEFSDDKGIAIWHVDESINGNIDADPHYMVSLEQADGRNDLEEGRNRGDSTDLFDLSIPLFSDNSKPNSKWWSGKNSGVRVRVLGDLGGDKFIQFGKLPADTIVLATPNGGEVIYRESKYFITWEANIDGDVKIDLYEKGNFSQVIVANTANTGSYEWDVPAKLSGGKNYTVRISSVSNPKPAFDVSDATFSVSADTFPANDQMPYGWYVPSGASAGWALSKSNAYEGGYSLGSKEIGDGRYSAIAYTSVFKSGVLTFYMKVSSEVGYDVGTFYLDGKQQTLNRSIAKKGLSGSTPWTFCAIPISAGKHTFEWRYDKDDSYAAGKDMAWIDGVLLPNTTQEIAIIDKKGTSLTSSKSTASFPDVHIGSESKPITFTIKNSGKSDLNGLQVDSKGEHGDSFRSSDLGKKILKPGESTTFKVVFAPKKIGRKSATIRILSNDVDESPFFIATEGTALGIPEILVSQPDTTPLKDEVSVSTFGYCVVGKTGKTKIFTVKNIGSANLTGIEVNKVGPQRSDFKVSGLGVTTLAPGESTTFKVTFSPSGRDARVAEIQVSSSYKRKQSFDVGLKGVGAPKGLSPLAAPGQFADAVLGTGSSAKTGVIGTSLSTETIDGLKYNTLTITKPTAPDSLKRTVEVSPNLVDWFSGAKHTTVVTDNETYQKVRDNTPVTPGVKRFIRVKTAQP